MADGLVVRNERKYIRKLPGIHIFIESCHLRIERALRKYVVLALYIVCAEAEVQEQKVTSFVTYRQLMP